jgi:N-acetylneuraminic acid mutarotase
VRIPVPGLATAELYDPAVGVWKSTGALATGRSGHSATLLADGRVLVAGGEAPRTAGVAGTLRSAEIYDPATGTWSTTGAMTDARWGHQAVALADGRVLVIGGIVNGADSGLAFCEVFDPATGVWTPTGSMATPRWASQATLLADGAVLVTGGTNTGMVNGWVYTNHSHRSAEIYDPAAGVWRPAPPMPSARSYHRAVRLATGSVLVIGGVDTANLAAGYRNVVLFDPTTERWSPAAGLATGRWAPGAVGLVDGRVLAFGGVTRSNHATPRGFVLVASTEVYTP